jgi:hypothetical protein
LRRWCWTRACSAESRHGIQGDEIDPTKPVLVCHVQTHYNRNASITFG